MSKIAWKPWHEVVTVRPDLKTGELSLAEFAADLYDVVMGKARKVYQDPAEFFSLTYPTFNLRELAKDVIQRLAGKSTKAVRQLELTYGGGKTHTLVALYHLAKDPDNLPKVPAVREFLEHAGIKPCKTRVAALCFDKLDVEKGMEMLDPSGKKRWLKHPWSVLAWQLAGSDGLKLLHADNQDVERNSPPAENLLQELLSLPTQENLGTLILIDEVLMYAHGKIALDPAWRGHLKSFFQYLTQAATKVDRCAIVASLLATDPKMNDQLGREISGELYAVFRREKEEGVQPVVKEDVAEILRRRLFTPDSIKDPGQFKSHVVAALKGIKDLDEQTRKDGAIAEERYLRSYPFHPELTEVFYSKWTSLSQFQRTRGVLRTYALAVREAEKWDESPLVGVNAFLNDGRRDGISEALRELTTTASSEEAEGKKPEWTAIVEGEIGKARAAQNEISGLFHREVEQAVVATFIHSQPIGLNQKAQTHELFVLLGHTRPDKILLEKALQRWADTSWFLDETTMGEAKKRSDGSRELPSLWRLGPNPNLRQMHYEAAQRIQGDLVEARLLDEIGKSKSLTAGAQAAGARVHNLPQKPSDIGDDGDFHFAVLGPAAASESGKPSTEARRFINDTTAADRPRVYRNSVVMAVPSQTSLDVVRNRIREQLGWEEVQFQLKDKELDPLRGSMLNQHLSESRKSVPEAIRQAYCIVVTVSEKNEIQAFKVTPGEESLFSTIKSDTRSRIVETAVTAEALLPEGPYDLWKEGDESRRVKDLVGAFAQFPHLPKMLNTKAILDTLIDGCAQGAFVLKLTRPDRSVRTFWRERPDEPAIREPSLEVVLPQFAELTSIAPSLLLKDQLPKLWKDEQANFGDIIKYFTGKNTVMVQRQGYEEPVSIPAVSRRVLEESISNSVTAGRLWLLSGPASILGEPIPAGVLNESAVLMAPPDPISAVDLLPGALPDAWTEEITTAMGLMTALCKKVGRNYPWIVIRDAIENALNARYLVVADGSTAWPCNLSGAGTVKIALPKEQSKPRPSATGGQSGVFVAENYLEPVEIQDLADHVGALKQAAVGHSLKYRIRLEFSSSERNITKTVEKLNNILKTVSDKLTLHGE